MFDNNHKDQLLNSSCQYIRLDNKGQLLYSSNNLFTLTDRVDILDLFPLLESIWPILSQSPSTDPIVFNGVQVSHPALSGFYDFSFKFIQSPEEPYVQWKIWDRTDYYRKFQAVQQRANEKKLRNKDN